MNTTVVDTPIYEPTLGTTNLVVYKWQPVGHMVDIEEGSSADD